ncbi:MAG TPA: aminotransferase class V-fold PLP-dependent enzyme [Nocardioides sp.]|uniref:aminotransferase class V-fold PLP-dependent enzyme n=1 Tax=Nocardioides sp. TaxID=35761 RepID=UPI002D80CF55|nr:aminotransferase class V-fold PLP-dependent enzyme [Nocardioides sp.]HET6651914.1 aminotransferase class V-fold PLP-dependent enzyme [Nocardioides sp.]
MLDAFDLDPDVVHLNHGSFGSVPRAVSAAQTAIRMRAEANPMRFFRVDSPGLKGQARHVAAEFLGVGADEVAMVRNVTQATAVVLSGLAVRRRLGPGDVVVIGEQGYESVRRTVAHWCRRTGASYLVVPHPVHADDADLVDGFRQALTGVAERGERAALVIVDQITSPTGTVVPVEQICALARSVGALTFVDAAHVPGHLPAHPERTGADFWTGTWHKWGFAPRGTSALWVAESERDTTEPLVTSWNHGQPFPWPFDTYGTDDYSGWFALGAAVEFWRSAGGPAIAERAVELLDKGAAVVASVLPEVDVEVPRTPAPCLRLVGLPDGVATTVEAADVLYERLSALGVEAQVTPYGGRGWIRLSGAVYNVPSDYERLADALPAALPSR